MTTTFARVCHACHASIHTGTFAEDSGRVFTHTQIFYGIFIRLLPAQSKKKKQNDKKLAPAYWTAFQQLSPGFTWQQHLNSTAARGFNVP